MRATVSDGVIRVQVSADGKRWPLVRLAPFPKAVSYFVGPMCYTPERAGLEVEFSEFHVGPPERPGSARSHLVALCSSDWSLVDEVRYESLQLSCS
jgi:regulation of enolase protein 1 (concanavalin A-like superfamily)